MKKQLVVVKIGSSSLTDTSGGISTEKMYDHVQALAFLKEQGHDVILISSGAVAAGFSSLGYPVRPKNTAGKQAAAAVGQGLLMQHYHLLFQEFQITPAQILITREDFYSQERFHNLFSTIHELLQRGAVPIINENDSVSIDELTFGDNDMLSALVSGFLHANALMILTDVDGLYDGNPKQSKDAKKYHFIAEVSDELLGVAGDSGSSVGTGGMKSKLLAAKKALSLGVSVFVGTGKGKEKLVDILAGKGDGTYIGGQFQTQMQMRKQWIAYHSQVKGTIEIDEGAEKAIVQLGKSLLPVGVTKVIGEFNPFDVVIVRNPKGQIVGKGQIYYSSEVLQKVKGLSGDYSKSFSINKRAEVIHRDNWVAILKEELER
ncbi:glutamate 5-kinase [Neobacillus niacini]|uniref:glutamate 5-kinase n=1 Tax=Neobacillus niacini TaxID=86668 RepID=UPI002861A13D|nr:glutamate 5-kinase [Neobacillus niacini]MDR7001077.1 glutamate 5-kinase [Neobacillus niacini]